VRLAAARRRLSARRHGRGGRREPWQQLGRRGQPWTRAGQGRGVCAAAATREQSRSAQGGSPPNPRLPCCAHGAGLRPPRLDAPWDSCDAAAARGGAGMTPCPHLCVAGCRKSSTRAPPHGTGACACSQRPCGCRRNGRGRRTPTAGPARLGGLGPTRSLKIWNVSNVCTRHLPRVMKLYDCIDDTSSPSVPALLPLPVLQLHRLYRPVRLYVTVDRVVSGPGCRRDRSRPRRWVQSAGPRVSLPGLVDLSLSCFLARIFHTFPLWVVAAAPHTDDEWQTKEPWVTTCLR
jgi:hypothetical protein